MTRRERLMATIRGESVDRPPVSFYELNGLDENPHDPDPFNIYTDPSWHPLIELTRDKTDRIVMRDIQFAGLERDLIDNLAQLRIHENNTGRHVTKTINVNGHVLTCRTRRDRDVNTIWTQEHLLKDVDDLRAFLEIPLPQVRPTDLITSSILQAEETLGDSGIVMLDTFDPLCLAAALFSMEDYTIIALTEPTLFHQLLEKLADFLLPQIKAAAQSLPGRLWRIYGPEYASPPYLPPRLFREYVVRYDTPMIKAIHQYGGYARIHSHGNLKLILDDIMATGCMGLDPIEPAPQGDVSLAYVRERYGKELVLFGNLEASDIENCPTDQFETKVQQALKEGTSGSGRGFVLMPSACPYGRKLSTLALKNYEKIIEVVEQFSAITC